MDPTYKDPNPFIYINGGFPPINIPNGIEGVISGVTGLITPFSPLIAPLVALNNPLTYL